MSLSTKEYAADTDLTALLGQAAASNINTVSGASAPESPPEQTQPASTPNARAVIRQALSPSVFQPNPMRLSWFFVCVGTASAIFALVVQLNPAWPIKLLAGLAIGFCTGTLGFVAHELGHGSIIQNQRWQTILGFFGTFPFLISPTYWKYTHNRLHHGKTQKLIEDPDAFPTLRIFKQSKFMQFMFPFTPGSRHKRSIAYFFFWLSFHYFVAQTYLRFRNRVYDSMNHRQVTLEFGGQILLMLGLMIYAGPSNLLWLFFIPMAIQNYMLMSYIATNHNLSPLTSENDALVNSLTVTNHPILEFLNLNFGYHVEHHLFPTISGKNIKAVHHALVKHYPEQFKCMPKKQAIRALYSTPRIYKTATELIHPETGARYPTL